MAISKICKGNHDTEPESPFQLIFLINISILALIGGGTWCLTGFDKTAGGESKRDHYLPRALRCLAVMFLSAIFLWLLESPASYAGIPILIIVPLCIAILLRSAFAEVFAHGFLGFIDPQLRDHRPFDPKQTQRYQDAIAHLIHNGHRDEAIKLCEELKQSGEVDVITLEHTLESLGVKPPARAPVKPLTEAARLREQGQFAKAEALLQSLLRKNPADDGAGIMLMRLYSQDLRLPDRAWKVLEALEQQPHVPAAHLEFARRSIIEWSHSPQQGSGFPQDSHLRKPPDSPVPAAATSERGLPNQRLKARSIPKPLTHCCHREAWAWRWN